LVIPHEAPPEGQPPISPMVFREIQGNSDQPGSNACLPPEVSPLLERPEEDLLRQRVRRIAVPQQRQENAMDAPLVCDHDVVKPL
jgi:hypothetical protein